MTTTPSQLTQESSEISDYLRLVVILLRRYDTVIGERLPDALRKSIELLLSELRRTLESVLTFYNALKLLTA